MTTPRTWWRLDDAARWSLRGGLRGRALVCLLPGVPGLRVWVGPSDREAAAEGLPWAWRLSVWGVVVRGDVCRLRRQARRAAELALEGAARVELERRVREGRAA